MSRSNRSDAANAGDVINRQGFECCSFKLIIEYLDRQNSSEITSAEFQHGVKHTFCNLLFKLFNLILKDSRSCILKTLYFVLSLLPRSTEAHRFLRRSSHLFHHIQIETNSGICLHDLNLRLNDVYIAFLRNINNLTWSPNEVFNKSFNLDDRISSQIPDVSLSILDMIYTILHTNEIIERTHAPQIVLLLTPRCVEDRRISIKRRIRLLTYNLMAINDCEDIVLI